MHTHLPAHCIGSLPLANLIFLAVCLLFASPGMAEVGRGLKPVSLTLPFAPKPMRLYGESYALVIGEAQYANGCPKLPGVKCDVEAVEHALVQHGFDVPPVPISPETPHPARAPTRKW